MASKLPTALLDQRDVWMDVAGTEHRLADMSEDALLWSLDYCLANASRLRDAWAIEHETTYDAAVKARRWMLSRPIVRAFMWQLVLLEDLESFDDRR